MRSVGGTVCSRKPPGTHITTGKIATLEHKVGDNAVELGASVAKALLARAQGAEVVGCPGHDLVVELEIDATGLGW